MPKVILLPQCQQYSFIHLLAVVLEPIAAVNWLTAVYMKDRQPFTPAGQLEKPINPIMPLEVG